MYNIFDKTLEIHRIYSFVISQYEKLNKTNTRDYVKKANFWVRKQIKIERKTKDTQF